MPITITSPSKIFTGTVTLPDFLTLPQVAAWDDAIAAVEEEKAGATLGDIMQSSRLMRLMLPGVLACVEQWNVAGISQPVDAETFPYTPRTEAALLVGAVMTALFKLVEGEQVPPA